MTKEGENGWYFRERALSAEHPLRVRGRGLHQDISGKAHQTLWSWWSFSASLRVFSEVSSCSRSIGAVLTPKRLKSLLRVLLWSVCFASCSIIMLHVLDWVDWLNEWLWSQSEYRRKDSPPNVTSYVELSHFIHAHPGQQKSGHYFSPTIPSAAL